MINKIKNDIKYLTGTRQRIQAIHKDRNINGQVIAIDRIFGIQNHLKKLEAILQKELYEKNDYSVSFNESGSFVINDVVINEDVFNKELIGYKPENKLELIKTIQEYTKDANEQDLVLMRDDIAYLQTIHDEICFSNIETNEYIFFSEQPDKFNEICEKILDEHYTITKVDTKSNDIEYLTTEEIRKEIKSKGYCDVGYVSDNKILYMARFWKYRKKIKNFIGTIFWEDESFGGLFDGDDGYSDSFTSAENAWCKIHKD